MLIEAYRVASVEGDMFPCPEGFTSESIPECEVTGEKPLMVERLTICAACDQTDCSIKHQTRCRRKAMLNRENFHCPEGQF
jgi:hypothetical protein